jgi:DNA-binding CsgD family transcriptional regulator
MDAAKTVEKIFGIRIAHAAERLGDLTPREIEVADLFANGKTGHQIGAELGISSKTVDIHRGKIKMKLGVKTTVDLVRFVLLKRLVDALGSRTKRATRSN